MKMLCDIPIPTKQYCPHEEVQEDWDGKKCYLVVAKCGKPALPNGWCPDHAYVQEMLDAAAALGYPPYVIAFVFDISDEQYKPALSVRGTQANWKAYAVRHPLRRHNALMARLRGEGL